MLGLGATGQNAIGQASDGVAPVPVASWYVPFSEPPRFKIGLLASQQQFYAGDTAVIPLTRMMPWYAPLSEPPRFKPGLPAALQQFFTAPSQLRPTPTITGILNALETKDTMLAGASVFNRVASGEIGVVESKTTSNEIGINVPTIARATIAITIL